MPFCLGEAALYQPVCRELVLWTDFHRRGYGGLTSLYSCGVKTLLDRDVLEEPQVYNGGPLRPPHTVCIQIRTLAQGTKFRSSNLQSKCCYLWLGILSELLKSDFYIYQCSVCMCTKFECPRRLEPQIYWNCSYDLP